MPRRRNPAIVPTPSTDNDSRAQADLLAHVLESNGDLKWFLSQIGIDDCEPLLSEWQSRVPPEQIAQLCDPNPNPKRVAEAWRDHCSQQARFNILELLIFESAIARVPGSYEHFAPNVHADSLESTILHLNWQLGIAFYRHGKEATWERPYVMVRSLQLSQETLGLVSAAAHPGGVRSTEALGRMATATALIRRHSEVQLHELELAEKCMIKSIEAGNDHPTALDYLAEIRLGLHDETNDPTHLSAIARMEGHSAALSLSRVEAYLLLAGREDTRRVKEWLSRAHNELSSIDQATLSIDLYTKCLILGTCLRASLQDGAPSISARFLHRSKLPFGAFRRIRELGADESMQALVSDIIDDLDRPVTGSWFSLTRRVFADCCRALADAVGPEDAERRFYLEKSIGAHRSESRSQHLSDAASRLHLGNDLIRLSQITSGVTTRIRGYNSLLESAVNDQSSASPFVLMGADLEANGPLRSASWVSGADPTWIRAISAGDYMSLYKVAARRALASSDLTRRYLGARESALVIDDHLELASAAIVFKGTTKANRDREHRRFAILSNVLETEPELGQRFGIPEFIDSYDLEHIDPTFGPQGETVSMLRFRSGRTLTDFLTSGPSLSRIEVELRDCSEYLAIIHSTPGLAEDAQGSVRSQLRRKELGVWLRNLFGDSGRDEFESWWTLVSEVPITPKRDAHPGNWILSATGLITAVDLESAGMRPIGWEVSQLTDDVPSLPVDDQGWETRLAILDHYLATLASRGVDIDRDQARHAYASSLLARAIRHVTASQTGERGTIHGLQLISMLRGLASPVADVAEAWSRRLNHEGGRPISRGRAVAISKTVSFILRHDREIDRDAEGWASIEDVLDRARFAGRRVRVDELRAIATLAKEKRFELRGHLIRARYGHSVAVDAPTLDGNPPPTLFHATSAASLSSIFRSRSGLLPMRRQQVHLSSDPVSAMAAGYRHHPTVLLSVEARRANEFRRASDRTWLSSNVLVDDIKIVSLMDKVRLGVLRLRV